MALLHETRQVVAQTREHQDFDEHLAAYSRYHLQENLQRFAEQVDSDPRILIPMHHSIVQAVAVATPFSHDCCGNIQ